MANNLETQVGVVVSVSCSATHTFSKEFLLVWEWKATHTWVRP